MESSLFKIESGSAAHYVNTYNMLPLFSKISILWMFKAEFNGNVVIRSGISASQNMNSTSERF